MVFTVISSVFFFHCLSGLSPPQEGGAYALASSSEILNKFADENLQNDFVILSKGQLRANA